MNYGKQFLKTFYLTTIICEYLYKLQIGFTDLTKYVTLSGSKFQIRNTELHVQKHKSLLTKFQKVNL